MTFKIIMLAQLLTEVQITKIATRDDVQFAG